MSLAGTFWVRKTDQVLIEIISDTDGNGDDNSRSLRATNRMTGRDFWLTPTGLGRKYTRVIDRPERNEP